MLKKHALILLWLLSSATGAAAQGTHYECLAVRHGHLVQTMRPYIGYTHRHHDFFDRAFSYQGIEAGVLLNDKLILAGYGAVFASNLRVILQNTPVYLSIRQYGFTAGRVWNAAQCLHTGYLVQAGYFSLNADAQDMPLWNSANAGIHISGMVLAPQLFAEVNINRWMRLRTGLAYNFYSCENKAGITRNDLQNISLDFAFTFARYAR